MAFASPTYPRPILDTSQDQQQQQQHHQPQPQQHPHPQQGQPQPQHYHQQYPPPQHNPYARQPPPQHSQPQPRQEDIPPRPQQDLGDALSYFDIIKTHYAEFPDVYVRFLDVLKDFKQGTHDTPAIVATIAKLFADSRELVEQLNDFLPAGYYVERGDPDTNVINLTIPVGPRQSRQPPTWPDRSSSSGAWPTHAATRWRNGDGLPWSPQGEPEGEQRNLAPAVSHEEARGLHLLGDLATRPSIASAAREALRAKLSHDAQVYGHQPDHASAWSLAATPAPGLPNSHSGLKREAGAMDVDDRHPSGNYYNSDAYNQMRNNSATSTTNSEFDKSEPQSPTYPRQRPRSDHGISSPRAPTSAKAGKRAPRKRSLSNASKTGPGAKPSAYVQQNSSRAFTCPFTVYGCTSTFGSKNEWKRHINTAHMRLGFWRCDIAPCDLSERKPNDFNRKDLFIQHVRRMHSGEKDPNAPPLSKSAAAKDPEEQALNAAAARCYRHIRSTPEQSGCLFCDAKFSGEGSWDERLEHVGRHMENAKKENDELVGPERWLKDYAMEDWLAREGLIIKVPGATGEGNVEGGGAVLGGGWTLAEGASVS